MLIQLIYLSRATKVFNSNDLTGILTSSRFKNELLGISGMLLYHDGSFLQILEGEEASVEALYRRIHLDVRHSDCEILSRSYIDRRSFGEWKMGFVNTNRYRNTELLAGYQDFLDLKPDQRQPNLAYKILMSFRDGALKPEMAEERKLIEC
jgi:Sensors of blue-light using FAD